MKLIGLDLGKNRTPFQNMTDEEEQRMKAELEAIISLTVATNSKHHELKYLFQLLGRII